MALNNPAAITADLVATKSRQQQALWNPDVFPAFPSGLSAEGVALMPDQVKDRFGLVKEGLTSTAAGVYPVDPDDVKFAIREKFVAKDGTVAGVGKAFETPDWQAYIQRKRVADEYAQFRQFVYSQVDMTTPAKRIWWETRFPQEIQAFKYGQQLQLADMVRTANLQIDGVQSEEDLYFLFKQAKGYNYDIPYDYAAQGVPNEAKGLLNLDDSFWKYWTTGGQAGLGVPLKYGMPMAKK